MVAERYSHGGDQEVGRQSFMFLLREGLCRGNQGGGCHGCHEGRHVGEGGGGQSHEDGS